MAVYDSAKTRQAAKLVARLAENVSSGISPTLRFSMEELEAMRGKTAEALEDRLLILAKKCSSIANELDELSILLERCADAMEEADEQLARKL